MEGVCVLAGGVKVVPVPLVEGAVVFPEPLVKGVGILAGGVGVVPEDLVGGVGVVPDLVGGVGVTVEVLALLFGDGASLIVFVCMLGLLGGIDLVFCIVTP